MANTNKGGTLGTGWYIIPEGFFEGDEIDVQEEIDKLLSDFDGNTNENNVKCECGAEKTYGSHTTTHSNWCPKSKRKDKP